MHSTYVLYSRQHDKIYIGESSDLETRLQYHNHGPSKGWTARYRPWELVHEERFATRREALRREKELIRTRPPMDPGRAVGPEAMIASDSYPPAGGRGFDSPPTLLFPLLEIKSHAQHLRSILPATRQDLYRRVIRPGNPVAVS